MSANPHDLTPTLVKYLDLHMVLSLLTRHEASGIYPQQDVRKAMLDLLEKTKMVDLTADVYQQINGGSKDIPKSLKDKRYEPLYVLRVLEGPECRLFRLF